MEDVGSLPETTLSYQLISVSIVSAQSGEEIADDKPEYAQSGKETKLFAVAKIASLGSDEKPKYYSLADKVRIGRRTISPNRILSPDKFPPGLLELKWYKLEPSEISYGYRNDPLQWAKTPWGEGWGRDADVHPTVFPAQFESVPGGLGVMRFQLEASLAGQPTSVASPGLIEKTRMGISKKAAKVTFVPDMPGWLGHLFALVNSPYIWGNYAHHADGQWGSDCADFVVAAWRRHGKKVKYTNAYGLRGKRYSRKKEAIKIAYVDGDRYYLDEANGRIPIGPDGARVGDVIFWPRHVGVLLKDACKQKKTTLFSACPGNGFLDESDLVIHTLFAPPTVEGIDAAYGTPLEVLRPMW